MLTQDTFWGGGQAYDDVRHHARHAHEAEHGKEEVPSGQRQRPLELEIEGLHA
jgi:hypothetical protein